MHNTKTEGPQNYTFTITSVKYIIIIISCCCYYKFITKRKCILKGFLSKRKCILKGFL